MARENGNCDLLLKQVKQNTTSTTTKLGPSLYMGIYGLFCSVSQNLIFNKYYIWVRYLAKSINSQVKKSFAGYTVNFIIAILLSSVY